MIANHILERLLIASKGVRPAAGSRAMFRVLTALTLTVALYGWLLDVSANSAAGNATGRHTASLAFPLQPAKRAAVVNPSASEQTTDAKLIGEVSQRLLAVAHTLANEYRGKYVWPPPFTLLNEQKLFTLLNEEKLPDEAKMTAFATLGFERKRGKPAPILDKEGSFYPYVYITQLFMNELIEGDSDRLALVLGHELAHILLGHVLPTSLRKTAQTKTMRIIFSAEQEHDADVLGLKLALAAGYSVQGAREVWLRIMSPEFLRKYPRLNITSFEGVGADHPAWTDRLALIDKEKEVLWKSMSAFDNGVLFLKVQQYATAEECFDRVVKNFPASYEAWANRGYARLMEYFDAFDEKDVANFEVGQIAVGSFYFRPETLQKRVRGVTEKPWSQAVADLRKALELKPDLTLAKANLGVAYLLSPTGKNINEAIRYLEEAVAAIRTDRDLSQYNRAAVLNNSAVALLAGDRTDQAHHRLRVAEGIVQNGEISAAVNYNRALLLAHAKDATQRREAASVMQNYLENSNPASIWWGVGYQRYVQLSSALGLKAEAKEVLKQGAEARRILRPVTSVELGKDLLVTLSDPVDIVEGKLGPAQAIPVVGGTNLRRLFYPHRGVEVLAASRVIAIILRGEAAPALAVRGLVMGSEVSRLRVGMTAQEIEKVLGKRFVEAPLSDPQLRYNFYPEVGLAVLYDKNKVVKELVIAQIAVERDDRQ